MNDRCWFEPIVTRMLSSDAHVLLSIRERHENAAASGIVRVISCRVVAQAAMVGHIQG